MMPKERTLSIIKPDAVKKGYTEDIIKHLESAQLNVVMRKEHFLTKTLAEQFYAVHKDRPFFGELVTYMSSGPVVLLILEGENAIAKNREIMGATDPKDAKEGTIRKRFGASIEENAVHGSDSLKNAEQEIEFFFPGQACLQ